MTALAPLLQTFFTERLIAQRRASGNTIVCYRNTFRLLLRFATAKTGTKPAALDIAELDAPLITAFLDHLEHERGNTVRTRNNRLAAIHSLFGYAALHHPEHAASIQRVLAIPAKRHERRLLSWLTEPEVDALLAAPDRATWTGRRDHAMLTLAVQTGLRISELIGLSRADVNLSAGAHVRCMGKGRNARLSHDAIEHRLALHLATARRACPSLRGKQVTMHTLRHTCSMRLLESGTDIAVIALWLGHEQIRTAQIYLHADMGQKERAIARVSPPGTRPGRYRPPDPLLAFLDQL